MSQLDFSLLGPPEIRHAGQPLRFRSHGIITTPQIRCYRLCLPACTP